MRLAEVADADAVGQVLRDFDEEFDAGGPRAAEFAGRFNALLDRDDVAVVLADDSARDVGFALLTLRPTPHLTLILRMAIETVRARGDRGSVADQPPGSSAEPRGPCVVHVR